MQMHLLEMVIMENKWKAQQTFRTLELQTKSKSTFTVWIEPLFLIQNYHHQ